MPWAPACGRPGTALRMSRETRELNRGGGGQAEGKKAEPSARLWCGVLDCSGKPRPGRRRVLARGLVTPVGDAPAGSAWPHVGTATVRPRHAQLPSGSSQGTDAKDVSKQVLRNTEPTQSFLLFAWARHRAGSVSPVPQESFLSGFQPPSCPCQSHLCVSLNQTYLLTHHVPAT